MQDQAWLAQTFVELADTLVDDFDVVELLSRLADRMVELVDAAEAGLMLADATGDLRVVASSSERMHVLEVLEIQNDEGPCLDCFRTGVALTNVTLADHLTRWPVFAPAARAEGYEVTHAFPLRLRDEVIGVANLFHGEQASLGEEETRLAQALADVATIGILQERALQRATEISKQLEGALVSRVVIEQAKGVLAEQLGVGTDEAFMRLRSFARKENLRLAEVARSVVNRTLSGATIDAEGTRNT